MIGRDACCYHLAKMRLVFSIFFTFFSFSFQISKKKLKKKKKRKGAFTARLISWYLKLKSCYFFQQVVKCLMDYNAKQNKKDIYGNTPLIYACLNGQYETTALLLQVRSLKTACSEQYFLCDICAYPLFRISIFGYTFLCQNYSGKK